MLQEPYKHAAGIAPRPPRVEATRPPMVKAAWPPRVEDVLFKEEGPQRLIVACLVVVFVASPKITPTTARPIVTQEAAPPTAPPPRPPRHQRQIPAPIYQWRPIPWATLRRVPAVFDPPARNTRSHTQGRSIVAEVILSRIDISRVKMDPKKLASRWFPKEVTKAVLNKDTRDLLEYQHLIGNKKYCEICAQGMPWWVNGTNTLFSINKQDLPTAK